MAEVLSSIFGSGDKCCPGTVYSEVCLKSKNAPGVKLDLCLQTQKVCNDVTLRVPAFNFEMGHDDVLVSKLRSLPRDLLPCEPFTQILVQFGVQNGQVFITINPDGSVVFSSFAGGDIPTGSYNFLANTLCYNACKFCPVTMKFCPYQAGIGPENFCPEDAVLTELNFTLEKCCDSAKVHFSPTILNIDPRYFENARLVTTQGFINCCFNICDAVAQSFAVEAQGYNGTDEPTVVTLLFAFHSNGELVITQIDGGLQYEHYILGEFELCLLRCDCKQEAPCNIKLTAESTKIVPDPLPQFVEGFGSYYKSDIVDNRFAVVYAANTALTRNSLALIVQTGKIKHGCKVELNCPVIVDQHSGTVPLDGWAFITQTVSIKPTNKDVLLATSHLITPSGVEGRVYRSIDGGTTWTLVRTFLPGAPNDLYYNKIQGIYDEFGNYWLVYLTFDGNNVYGISYQRSIDDGTTFSQYDAETAGAGAAYYDPALAYSRSNSVTYGGSCGPCHAGGTTRTCSGTLLITAWSGVAEPIYNNTPAQPFVGSILLRFVEVNALNNFSGLLASSTPATIFDEIIKPQIVAGPCCPRADGSGSDIKFYIVAQGYTGSWNNFGKGFAYYGLLNHTPGDYAATLSNKRLIYQTDVGVHNIVAYDPTYQDAAGYGLGYNPALNRLYVTYLSQCVPNTASYQINLIFSDDDGQTWSYPWQVSDVVRGVRGRVNLTYDPCKCLFLLSWYDTRCSVDCNQSVDFFFSLFGN